jgi:phosphoribosylamine--glycine ligase
VRILVVGSGAREHALCRALSQDGDVDWLGCAPGNAGTSAIAENLAVDLDDRLAVADLAEEREVDLVVVGPEAPLVLGVADECRRRGIPVFGPDAAAAQLEGSKAFAKDVMRAAGVPTAAATACVTRARALAALEDRPPPYVVKYDGLAGGKGVTVTDSLDEACGAVTAAFDGAFGGADVTVVIEDFLDGPEVSLLAITDGETVVPLEPAQDAKRLGDGDTGPNTGGMGAYSPLPWAPPDLAEVVTERIARPTIAELGRRGTPFVGVLYAGLALTDEGPKVVEFNVRFGDPETQALLARLRTPLAGLLLAAATGRLAEHPPLEWADDAAVTVVVAAPGYPADPRSGDPIDGLAEAAAEPGVHVLHAGTAADGDRVISAGGRVLAVTATGPDLAAARERAYAAVAKIRLPGAQVRTDIAARAAGAAAASAPGGSPGR